MKYFTVFALLSFSVVAVPKDVKGYKNTNWSMTEDMVTKSLKGKVEKDKSGRLVMEVELAGDKYEIRFMFAKDSKKLNRVGLFIKEDRILVIKFDRLKQLLVRKYGKPTSEVKRKASSGKTNAVWQFKTTIIELAHIKVSFGTVQNETLVVSYTPTSSDNLDDI